MIIIPANTLSTGGYEVTNSCRFNPPDAPYFAKNPTGDGNQRTFTISVWLKMDIHASGATHKVFETGTSTNYFTIYFTTEPYLYVKGRVSGSTVLELVPSRSFRDPTSWFHLYVAVDTTQGTESDRCKIYINGSQVTSFGTANYPSQNTDFENQDASEPFEIGVNHAHGSDEHFDGYMAEYMYVDGAVQAISDFGEFDEDSPTIWKPKDISAIDVNPGAAQASNGNGFYLDFKDSSNLGNDVGVNAGTDFSENNIVAADQSTDTCTNNYPTWNPLTNFGDGTLSEGNTRFTGDSGDYTHCGTTFAASKGKWYFEMQHAQTRSKVFMFCLHDINNSMYFKNNDIWFATSPNSTGTTSFYLQLQNTNHATNRDIAIRKYVDQTQSDIATGGGNLSAVLPVGILQIYLDLDNRRIHYYNNGTAIDQSNAASSTAGYGAIPAGTYSFSITDARAPDSGDDGALLLDLNFGSPSANISISSGNTDANGHGNFEYSPTVGGVNYYAMNSKNLAEFG